MGVVSHRDSGDLNASITRHHPINLQKRGHSPLKKGTDRVPIPPSPSLSPLPPDEGGRGGGSRSQRLGGGMKIKMSLHF